MITPAVLYQSDKYIPKIGLVIGAALLFIFVRKKSSVEKEIKPLLPDKSTCKRIVMVKGGFANNLWRVDTESGSYIFRSPKVLEDNIHFKQILEVAKIAYSCGIAPQVIGFDIDRQRMLLAYVDQIPWQTFEENPEAYRASMKALKLFHDETQPFSKKCETHIFFPFSFIFSEGLKLEKGGNMPHHFSAALKKAKALFETLLPWLNKHATMCHGDFHKGNVLLANSKKPYLIDFDSCSVGDPFFDVAKFSVALPQQVRLALLSEYLGKTLDQEAIEHFELSDLALLMVITANRYKSAEAEHTLSKAELEEILDSKPNASFLTLPFANTSSKSRQLGATYALAEFLKRTKDW